MPDTEPEPVAPLRRIIGRMLFQGDHHSIGKGHYLVELECGHIMKMPGYMYETQRLRCPQCKVRMMRLARKFKNATPKNPTGML